MALARAILPWIERIYRLEDNILSERRYESWLLDWRHLDVGCDHGVVANYIEHVLLVGKVILHHYIIKIVNVTTLVDQFFVAAYYDSF